MTIQEHKALAVMKTLVGIEVVYYQHHPLDKVPNMAKVNGYSIVWHEYAYGADDLEQVEVMGLDRDCDRVDIDKLRELVE